MCSGRWTGCRKCPEYCLLLIYFLASFVGADQPLPVTDGNDRYTAAVAAPILCEGDVLGLVLFLSAEGQIPGEGEYKLAQTVSAFLGKHMEA